MFVGLRAGCTETPFVSIAEPDGDDEAGWPGVVLKFRASFRYGHDHGERDYNHSSGHERAEHINDSKRTASQISQGPHSKGGHSVTRLIEGDQFPRHRRCEPRKLLPAKTDA